MLFSWLKRRRRDRLRNEPFPADWEEHLRANFRAFSRLTELEKTRLRGDIAVFAREKNWEGVFGMDVDDEVRVTVAAQACHLTLGLDVSWYDQVLSILIYPDAYTAPDQFTVSGGIVIEGRSERLGEAWYRGPVILSWPDVLAGGRQQTGGHNLVYHEFAHQLDMRNGRHVDGTPPLESRDLAERWQRVLADEYQRLCDDCRFGRARLLDCYGTTSHAEFFAVATETFFQQPVRMQRRHPKLYALFQDFYRQDPAARLLHGPANV